MLKMAYYSLANASGYDEDATTFKILNHQDICVCCLTKNVKFIRITTCKHRSFFDIFSNIGVAHQNYMICYQCHYFLKKIEYFKAQVEESFKILSEQAYEVRPNKKIQNLQLSFTNITSPDDDYEVLKSESAAPTSISHEDHYTDLTTDVKIEHESCSDFEKDIPLSEIKKEIKIKKVRKKKKNVKSPKKVVVQDEKSGKEKKRSNLYEKYEGKIGIVTLTEEEMILERALDAKKESYLKLPYKCESCIIGFDHELTLKDHMTKRHGENKNGFVCDVCKSVLSTRISFKEHAKRHTRRYECLQCGKRNNNIHSVAKHYSNEHERLDTEFTCEDCGFVAQSHRSYRYHREKHKQKPMCSICGSTFVNGSGLRAHLYTVHKQSSRVYSCSQCGKVYKAKSGLVAHAASAHGGARVHCATCRTQFRAPHSLLHHLRTHSRHVTVDDKKFICNECDSKFLTKIALQEHIDFVHLKSNKYECGKCGKVFKNSGALKKHDNFVHKKLRPPRNKICDHCGRGFTTLSILRCHVRTHTGERPLQCARCPATFAHSAALYTHNKLLHARARRGLGDAQPA